MVAALKSQSVQAEGKSQKTRSNRFWKRERAVRSHAIPPNPCYPVDAYAKVTALPQAPPVPSWLMLLLKLQQGTAMITGVLMVTMLGLYSHTVSLKNQVNQGTQRLADLQQDQQQLTTANEVLKNHMAEQAESPGAGLTPPHPRGMLFLNSSAPAAVVLAETTHALTEAELLPVPSEQQPLARPLGY